ncbi:hypothetical protein ACLMJK_007372 [Lecanora helva]
MSSAGHKRVRLSPELPPHRTYQGPPSHLSQQSTVFPTSAPASNSSSFRNVSACNRCRLRKNRCDQNLPACVSCEKAGVKCVGFDPITKKEIPRTYVYYLESRVRYLEGLLHDNGVQYAPANDFDLGAKPTSEPSGGQSPLSERSNLCNNVTKRERTDTGSVSEPEWKQKQDESEKLHKLVSNVGMVSVQGASDPRFLGSTSGISFARVVFAAVKSSVPGASSDKNGGRGSKPGSVGSAVAANTTSMRDSFFGLQSKPNIKPAPFPDRALGLRLVNLYFEHANPQIPILHRPEFMGLFARAYASKDRQRSARELYMLNIVFAIGAGILLEDSSGKDSSNLETGSTSPMKQEPASPNPKRLKASNQQRQPEEYHASAMIHLESFLGSMPAADQPDGFGGGLEQLQAVLLLAGFALLRPVAPGLWYITGVAVRLGVDLGLHYEDDADVQDDRDSQDTATNVGFTKGTSNDLGTAPPALPDRKERGRKQWMRDLRRRLWWCVYSFDRLVSTCVGRPFGITDAVITTDFPSVLNDKDITPDGFLIPSHVYHGPSYKRVSHHYFRLRLLQSEILQVLQYRQAQNVHEKGRKHANRWMHTKLSSSFLEPFDTFHAWRKDIDRRLWEWKESAPLQEDIAVDFSVKFLELNYWQAVIMLYRQSLSVPPDLAGEACPHNEVESPLTPNNDDYEHEDDIFLKLAEAGQRVLKLYRSLHRVHLVNYTYLATVHLFMAGSLTYQYPFQTKLICTLDDVDLTVLAATSVLSDLMKKCPPAEACRDAFERMSKATIKMCINTTGFGSQVKFAIKHDDSHVVQHHDLERPVPSRTSYTGLPSRPPPKFDDSWRDLFPENMLATNGRSVGHLSGQWQTPTQADTSSALQQPSVSLSHSSAVPNGVYMTGDSISNYQQIQSLQPQYNPSSTSQPSSTVTESNNDDLPDYGMFDFDFLANSDNLNTISTFTGDSGLSLGFDSHYDWADAGNAQLPDLFGGFFFGGSAGEAAGMDPTEAYPISSDFGDNQSSGAGSMWNGGQEQ